MVVGEAPRAALIGGAVAALVTLPGLGNGTLWDNSETAYGEVAREVLLYHDAVVLHLNGTPWFVQPPLYFWIAAFFLKVFGVAPLALRLPSALATIGMGAGLAWMTARVAGLRTGVAASVILSTSLIQAIVGRLAIMDALLDLGVMMAILWAFEALSPHALDDRRAHRFVGACVALALAFLAKGPVALAIFILVLGGWIGWERRCGGRIVWPAMRSLAIGCALFLLLVAPWFVAVALRAGAIASSELIGHYTFGRYLGTIENQTGPVYYYVPVVILGLFPWVAYLPGAIGSSLRRSTADTERGHLRRLALVWAIVPFLFFSFAKTKLPNYIALEFPAFALLIALWFESALQAGRRRGLLFASAAVPITLGGVAFAIFAFSRDMHLTADTLQVLGDLLWLGVVLFAGSLATFVLFASGRTSPAAPYALALAGTATVLLIAFVAEPHAEPLKPIPQLAKVVERERRPPDAVAIQGVAGGNALLFYSRPRIATLAPPDAAASDAESDPRRVICAASRAFVVTSKHRPANDPTYGRRRRELARSNNDILYLYDGPPCAATLRSRSPGLR